MASPGLVSARCNWVKIGLISLLFVLCLLKGWLEKEMEAMPFLSKLSFSPFKKFEPWSKGIYEGS